MDGTDPRDADSGGGGGPFEGPAAFASHFGASTGGGSDGFCRDLTSRPRSETGRVLVTGASGYIGGRLVPELLARGYRVRTLLRGTGAESCLYWPGAEGVVGDALDKASLGKVLAGVDTAYYLIHSMVLGKEDFAEADLTAARNFREAAAERGVKRIIYLGGLGDTRERLSEHLKSRMEVADELARGPVPVTILRAAIIIGSGSASYEIIKHLILKLPVIFIPRWAEHRCQPIAIRDVIKYLVGVLETPETRGKTFDIGGPDILSYKEMMRVFSGVLHLKRLFVPSPIRSIGFYAYLGSFFTPVPAPITRGLMGGLKNDVVCGDEAIREYLPFRTVPYREALVRALSREEQDRVSTRWSDAYPPAHELALKLHELTVPPRYRCTYSRVTGNSAAGLFEALCRIGGRTGWFYYTWMWKARGLIDRLFGGVGTARGRRSDSTLKVHDVIDFWRVEALEPDRRLLLRAEMKLPGRAWLEFRIEDEPAEDGEQRRLFITALYDTKGFFGRFYWYFFYPFHHYIFNDLLRQIDKRAGERGK